jgi:hypothetical protein
MNIPQHVNNPNDPTSNIIEFDIQTLEGKEFSVCIQKSDGEKVSTGSDKDWSLNAHPYDSYGLDFLKEAISKRNGADPITMQLFAAQGELTTATPLLSLQNQVLSLMVKSPITVTLQNPQTTVSCEGPPYALERNIDFLKGTGTCSRPTVCYIHTPHGHCPFSTLPLPVSATTIQAVGRERNFFKISIKNLPFHLLRDSAMTYAEPFILRPLEMPKHVWLRFDKSAMTHD